MDTLKNYDKDNIKENTIRQLRPILSKPTFKPTLIATKSQAMSGLCEWVNNMVGYYEVYKNIKPKKIAVQEANNAVKSAQMKLKHLRDKITKLENDTLVITRQFDEANERKNKALADYQRTMNEIDLANRLINGLESESKRWTESVKALNAKKETNAGNILLVSVFISYAGAFSKAFRNELMVKKIYPLIKSITVRFYEVNFLFLRIFFNLA